MSTLTRRLALALLLFLGGLQASVAQESPQTAAPKEATPAIPATPLRIIRSAPPPASETVGPESLRGKPCPDFEMKTINDDTLTNATLKGKVVLIDFWATWCGPCIKASPIMQTLHEKYADRGLVVIGANTSERDADGNPLKTPERAKQYAEKHDYTYTFTYGADDFKNACHVRGIPTMLVVNQEGVVHSVVVGYSDTLQQKLEDPISALLERDAE